MLYTRERPVPPLPFNFRWKPSERRQTMTASILLITEDLGASWNQVFVDAVSSIGPVLEATEHNAINLLIGKPYDLVLIDGSAPTNLSLLVARVKAIQPRCRVVVATPSPDWEAARAVFQAGAVDYFSKSYDKAEILHTVRAALGGLTRNSQISGD